MYLTLPVKLAIPCLETCTTACHNSEAWIQGPVHLLMALACFLLFLLVHQGAKHAMPGAWLYAGSVPLTVSLAWEVCSYSILGSWNWPRLLWPCAGVLSVLACLGVVAYRIEQSFPGLTSSYFK